MVHGRIPDERENEKQGQGEKEEMWTEIIGGNERIQNELATQRDVVGNFKGRDVERNECAVH